MKKGRKEGRKEGRTRPRSAEGAAELRRVLLHYFETSWGGGAAVALMDAPKGEARPSPNNGGARRALKLLHCS